MTVLGSGLRAGKVFPVRVTDPSEVEHRRLLAEAINHVAAAAYTPETQIEEVEDVDLDEAGTELFSIDVTPFVPARAHVLLVLQVSNGDAALDLSALVELYENAVKIADTTITLPTNGSIGDAGVVVLQKLRDLEPNTTYTYSVTAYDGDGVGGSGQGLAAAGSSLTVRAEHRRIIP